MTSELGNSASRARGSALPAAPAEAPVGVRSTVPSCPWQLSEWAVQGFLGGHRGATRAAYASDLRDLLRFADQREQPVLQLRRLDLDAYLSCLLGARGLAVSTVRRRLVVTHQLFAWAVEEGLLDRNPAARLRRPRPQAPRPRVRLAAGQVRLLLAAAEADSLRSAVLVHFLAVYGCRIGEVLGVDVNDLNGPAGARRVWLLVKGGDVRELRLTADSSLLVDRLADAAGPGPLLRSATGRRWHRTNAARHLRRLAHGVLDPDVADRLHPHALRRSWVDIALATGSSLGELQTALGHRSSAMVLVYAAQQIDGLDPVAWQVAAALSSTPRSAVAAGADDLDREAGVARVHADEGVGQQPPVEAVQHQVDLGLGASLRPE